MTGLISIDNPEFIENIGELMRDEFNVDQQLAIFALKNKLGEIIKCLRENIVVFIEPDYVDRVYRDSYYNYFSSKAEIISRDCIRLSFLDNSSGVFSGRTNIDYNMCDDVSKNYLGFVIIRPTVPAVIGRSAISPKALKVHDFKCCLSPISSTVNGFKVKVEAFPFSSQDRETITCAETSVWALMEYYGNKYPEYSPVKPSDIIHNLKNNIVSRQLPSNGLTVRNVTFALKTFGFGPQLYEYSSFGDHSSSILSCYIESGIPVVVALSNAGSEKRRINHAVLCIGHENVSQENVVSGFANKHEELLVDGGKLRFLDYDKIDKRFVFIDDNCPPYQKDLLSSPANRYSGMLEWNACRIANFIAPLYRHIYMEPFVVKDYVRILISNYYSHLKGEDIVVRTYLCSTRSFRHFANTSAMSNEMKDVISRAYMPKFIWIAEISKIENFQNGLVDNLIIVDATSCETSNLSPLIVAFVDGACYCKNPKTRTFGSYIIATKQFNSYSNLR